ncbi:MAG: SMR family transporter [Marinovum sp.]|nr:SMR family transporter [Marinovum sp.]
MPAYLALVIAVAAETIGTTALKASEQFTKLGPSLVVIVAYAVAFYFLAMTLRTIPVGIAYALWSGLGIFLITFIGWFVFGQKLDGPALIGLGLIVAGIAVMQLFSKTIGH